MLLVGLGNPGMQYETTRHNAGWIALDFWKSRHHGPRWSRAGDCLLSRICLGQKEALLVKPMLFMNRSGVPVSHLIRKHAIAPSELIVLHDDLDIPLGAIRIKHGGGTGGHKGIESIVQSTGQSGFIRVRIGIGKPETTSETSDYVLSPPSGGEEERFFFGTKLAADAVDCIVFEGIQKAMNIFNSRSAHREQTDTGVDGETNKRSEVAD